MENGLILDLFFVLFAALLGGLLSRITKLPTLIGYIVAGLAASVVLPFLGEGQLTNIQSLAELGIILLLFSIGLEFSVKKLFKVGNVVFVGALVQLLLTIAFSWVILQLLGLDSKTAIIFGVCFSLSSTAIVVKILTDKAEKGTIHGQIMMGWSLVQDLAVIPLMTLLPVLTGTDNAPSLIGKSLLSGSVSILAVFFIGRLVVPPIIHKIASYNSKELLSLAAFCIAIGTAFLVSAFGVSTALGAFLAGIVISESQENHAVFAEVRPLRDLFVVLFFVTLGFLVTPQVIIVNLPLILLLVVISILLKQVITLVIMFVNGYYGKTALAVSFGLAQISEFSFVIYLASLRLGIITSDMATIGIATTLITLMITPFMFNSVIPVWRKLKSSNSLGKLFWRGYNKEIDDKEFKNHVIICGYGRVGKWVGKAMEQANVEYIVIDYNQKIVSHARSMGIKAIYGDPADPEILREADLTTAKAVVITVPDTVSQHETISYIQTVSPDTKIIVRSDLDEDIDRLKILRVGKIIQPEFEGALAIVRNIFVTMGKSKEEISQKLKSLRAAHSIKS
ncbi:cation:proton antiporter [Candidatus Microgenomates bacterium]|nr:cation:proton antiporter [Candidatus Microgenomates bacterium]